MAAPAGITRFAKWGAGIFGLLLVLSCTGGPLAFPLLTVFYACFGWIGFLWRALPQITVNWSGMATGTACLVGVIAGGHWFLSWLYASLPQEADSPRTWRLRWTLGLVASVVLMFTSGICVVGIAHQTAWLATSKEPLVGYNMASALRSQSNNNLKQIDLGVLNYHDLHHELPAGATFDKRGRPLHGWQTVILPFVEMMPLYKRIDRSLAWDTPENHWAFSQHVPSYMHPKLGPRVDERGYALSGYAGNAYVLGGPRSWTLDEITDGAAMTILCGQATTSPRPWGDPANWRDPALGIRHTPDSFGGPFEGVTQFVFVDGHTHAISNKIDPAVFRALCTPAAGESIRGEDGE